MINIYSQELQWPQMKYLPNLEILVTSDQETLKSFSFVNLYSTKATVARITSFLYSGYSSLQHTSFPIVNQLDQSSH